MLRKREEKAAHKQFYSFRGKGLSQKDEAEEPSLDLSRQLLQMQKQQGFQLHCRGHGQSREADESPKSHNNEQQAQVMQKTDEKVDQELSTRPTTTQHTDKATQMIEEEEASPLQPQRSASKQQDEVDKNAKIESKKPDP